MIFHQNHPQRLSGSKHDLTFAKKSLISLKLCSFLPFNKYDCDVKKAID